MRIQSIVIAAAMTFSLLMTTFPAFAHDGVTVVDAYARTAGGAGSNGAVFMVLDNHADRDDRLLGVMTDAAEKADMHTHAMSDDGLMQMLPVEGGFAVPPLGQHALARGGDHIMLTGLTRDLVDGDVITLTLRFEASGDMVIEVPVDNQRSGAGSGHDGTTEGHDAGHTSP